MPANDNEILATSSSFEEDVLTAIYDDWSATWGRRDETIDDVVDAALANKSNGHVETALDAMSGYLVLVALDAPNKACPLSAYQRARQAVEEAVTDQVKPKPGHDAVEMLIKHATKAAHTPTAKPVLAAERPSQPAVGHVNPDRPALTDHSFGNYVRVYGQLLDMGLEPEIALSTMSEGTIQVMLGQGPKEPAD